MASSRPVEITGVWSPEKHKELKWGRLILKTKISDGYPGGHSLLDVFLGTSMPWLNLYVKEYVSKGKPLCYEYIRMVGSKKKGRKITFEDIDSGKKAQIDKSIFLDLINHLEEDFHENHSSKSKDVTTEEKGEGQTSYRKGGGSRSPRKENKPQDRKRGRSQSPTKEQKPESPPDRKRPKKEQRPKSPPTRFSERLRNNKSVHATYQAQLFAGEPQFPPNVQLNEPSMPILVT